MVKKNSDLGLYSVWQDLFTYVVSEGIEGWIAPRTLLELFASHNHSHSDRRMSVESNHVRVTSFGRFVVPLPYLVSAQASAIQALPSQQLMTTPSITSPLLVHEYDNLYPIASSMPHGPTIVRHFLPLIGSHSLGLCRMHDELVGAGAKVILRA